MKYIIRLYFLFLFQFAIESYARQITVQQDTSLTISNSVTGLHVNAQLLVNFKYQQKLKDEEAENMESFYRNRNYQYAWFNEEGVAEQAQSFWNLYENFLNYSGDSSLYHADLHEQMGILLQSDSTVNPLGTVISATELRLTQLFLNFVELAYHGKVNPKSLQWYISRKKVSALQVLNEFVEHHGEVPESILPIHPQYLLLREKLLNFRQLQGDAWPAILSTQKRLYKLGDTAAIIAIIKNRLYKLGDLIGADTSKLFNSLLETAVINFQRRHGLTGDGIIGPIFMKAINIPIEEKIEQMLINMERLRWMPVQREGKKVVVNIPEFKLHVYENNEEVLSMGIVVGKIANRTVVFSDKIKYVVFSPYWNIPRNIIRNEILPEMKKNLRYLARNNMEITGERNGLPIIRQRPGRKNALGRVKFIFPNRYNIYLHDTPTKGLFQRPQRAFSHGCIRVAKPIELAMNLLENQAEWTEKTTRQAMHSDSEKWVILNNPVPVFIGYFTSWVDQEGQLNFRDDIYGHDKKVAAHLF